jgi:hypothetical protein
VDRPEVAAVKNDVWYHWTLGELLPKYCDAPRWQFDEEKNRVEFRGTHRATGQELVAVFLVYFGYLDKSNTKKGWVVVRESFSLGGRSVPYHEIFVEEDRAVDGPGRREEGTRPKP